MCSDGSPVSTGPVYLNGRWVPYDQACISVEDRGNVFADGIYEVILVRRGRFFCLERHLERLERSAAAIRLRLPLSRWELAQVLQEAVTRAGLEGQDSTVYLQVSRGTGHRQHVFSSSLQPTLWAVARPLSPLPQAWVTEGAAAVVVPDRRWEMCNVKSLQLLYNVLARQQASEAGAYEAILVRQGVVTEGAATNVFMVRDGVVFTHPTGPHILPGITRSITLEVAAAAGIPIREETFTVEQLRQADEVFLTGTTIEVLPVVRLDRQPVGGGWPGPIAQRLRQGVLAREEQGR